MLLNEFLKEHRKVEAQNQKIESLEAQGQQFQQTIIALQAALKDQAAQIQKVSAQVQQKQDAPRLVSTND